MIDAMNALAYDAATLGNHEYNYGLEVLAAALSGATFPFLNANVLKPDATLFYRPWTILEKRVVDEAGENRSLKIGVVGFVTPQIVRWDISYLAGRATTTGIVEAARIQVPALRAAGADIVVALCHAGISKTGLSGADENAGLALADVEGIDAIFVGHQHLLLPGADFEGVAGVDAKRGRLGRVPACMPGFWGRNVGVIDLTLAPAANGWRVTGADVEARAIGPDTPAAPAVLTATETAHQATLQYVRAPVGEIEQALTSYFAMIGDDDSVRIVNDAQAWYVGKLAAAIPALQGAPILSASAPFKCGGRGGVDYYTATPAGPVALRHIADLYVYPNGLRVVGATGAVLREWLERSASGFCVIDPAATTPQPLLQPDFAPYDFDTISGVSFRLDLTKAARYDDQGRIVAPGSHRVVDLQYEGRAIDEQARFLVVTNSYRASGGGHFPGCDGSSVVYEAPDANRDALLQYVRERKRVRPSPGGRWRFAPWGASVTATLLAPPAAARVAPPEGVSVARLGPGPDGFDLFRVTPIS
jgi:2',3'-cyclic-nucleotide 2'-phosphodiesterase/3'-nucleotidase